jgi:hypothetical protein
MSNVYFIQAGQSGPIKIGIAIDVRKRLLALGCGSPEKLFLRATIPGGQKLERRLHRALRDHRLEGEWFSFAPLVRVTVAVAKLRGLEAIERFLDRMEAAPRKLVPSMKAESADFVADVKRLWAVAIKLAVERHGTDAVQEALDVNRAYFQQVRKGQISGVSKLLRLAALDPEACAPLFARINAVLVEDATIENARDALDGLLASLAPRRSA